MKGFFGPSSSCYWRYGRGSLQGHSTGALRFVIFLRFFKMAVSPVYLRALLERSFPDAAVALKDFIGDGNHIRVRVISALFEGKTRVQRHSSFI